MPHPSHSRVNFPPVGEYPTEDVRQELINANIPTEPDSELGLSLNLGAGKLASDPIHVMGVLHKWSFQRNWYYYDAKGPGIPIEYAEALHEHHGNSCRVDGCCGCPHPRERFNGLGAGRYHVDTPEALKALSMVIRAVVEGIPVDDLEFEDIPDEKGRSMETTDV